MKKLRNFITPLHKSAKRNYLDRMLNEKAKCVKIAKKFDYDYWDGSRRTGFGGYKYILGHWKPMAEKLIKNYNLKSGSKVLDVGCGKGFLLNDLKLLEPKLNIIGFDINIDVYALFSKILAKAKARVEAWGGTLYFVYLPESNRYGDKSIFYNQFHPFLRGDQSYNLLFFDYF